MLEGYRVGILVEEGFEDSELVEITRAMSDSGAVVGHNRQWIQSQLSGLERKGEAKVDSAAENVRAEQLDASGHSWWIRPGQDAPASIDGGSG